MAICPKMNTARLGFFVFNILLGTAAITCLIGGIVLRLGAEVYGDELEWIKEMLQKRAQTTGIPTLDTSRMDFHFMTNPLGIAYVVTGMFMLGIAIFGIVTSYFGFYRTIVIYLAILFLVLFAQTVVVICAYVDREPFDDTAKEMLKNTLVGYNGDRGEDADTLGWNAFMVYKKCCGVDSYLDFNRSVVWERKIRTFEVDVPAACCIEPSNPPTCATGPYLHNETYYDRGCYQHMFDHVTSSTQLVILSVFFIIFFEYMCGFFGLWVYCERRSEGLDKVGIDDDVYLEQDN